MLVSAVNNGRVTGRADMVWLRPLPQAFGLTFGPQRCQHCSMLEMIRRYTDAFVVTRTTQEHNSSGPCLFVPALGLLSVIEQSKEGNKEKLTNLYVCCIITLAEIRNETIKINFLGSPVTAIQESGERGMECKGKGGEGYQGVWPIIGMQIAADGVPQQKKRTG
ncbi:hypothetical protein PAMP_024870 [Pampus punctatissimus]